MAEIALTAILRQLDRASLQLFVNSLGRSRSVRVDYVRDLLDELEIRCQTKRGHSFEELLRGYCLVLALPESEESFNQVTHAFVQVALDE